MKGDHDPNTGEVYEKKTEGNQMNIEGRPFTDIIGEIENGDFLADLTSSLYNVVRAVQDTRKPGSIKMAFTITPTGKGSVEIDTKVDVKEPEHDRPSTTFFVAKDGSLLRNDPNQMRLPLREVDVPRNAPIKVEG